MSQRLHYRHRQFLANYILLAGNGVQAVYAAGYKQGYDSACVTASRLLRNAKVASELEKHANKAAMSADSVISELSGIAQVDTPIDGNQRLKALELLGKFHKLFVDRSESSVVTASAGDFTAARTKFADAWLQRTNCSPAEAEAKALEAFPDLTPIKSTVSEVQPETDAVS